jgi:hypothetical protein
VYVSQTHFLASIDAYKGLGEAIAASVAGQGPFTHPCATMDALDGYSLEWLRGKRAVEDTRSPSPKKAVVAS